MNHLKSITIHGFKKFQNLHISFNEHLNLLVGENEAGKSTILEAIKIVLNQLYKNTDRAILQELFNLDDIELFTSNPSIKTLPSINLELELTLDPKQKNAEYFYGMNNINKVEGFGIVFECKFNEELGIGLESEIEKGKIPYEYYSLSWKTFAGHPYQMIKRPCGFIFIDTSSKDSYSSFNYYNKTLFNSSYDDNTRASAKNLFRDKLSMAFTELDLPLLDENKKFGIDGKKVILDNIVSVYENNIPLENKGSGMESLIKTEIALEKKSSHLDVILMEEPENHLSYTNLLKMIKTIENKQCESQIIIATHSNMIASRLNLKNVIWITNNKTCSLMNIDKNVADFFVKADNNSFLNLLLSKKAILVEGATEYLLVPHFYKQIYGTTIEDDNITIISCNGVSYNNYLTVLKDLSKKVAVITDNDKKTTNIEKVKVYNNSNEFTHIFMANDLEKEWTWEAAIYSVNKDALDKLIEVRQNSDYLFHGENYGKTLGKMLNNKVDTAYEMVLSGIEFNIPDYVKEALEWIKE